VLFVVLLFNAFVRLQSVFVGLDTCFLKEGQFFIHILNGESRVVAEGPALIAKVAKGSISFQLVWLSLIERANMLYRVLIVRSVFPLL